VYGLLILFYNNVPKTNKQLSDNSFHIINMAHNKENTQPLENLKVREHIYEDSLIYAFMRFQKTEGLQFLRLLPANRAIIEKYSHDCDMGRQQYPLVSAIKSWWTGFGATLDKVLNALLIMNQEHAIITLKTREPNYAKKIDEYICIYLAKQSQIESASFVEDLDCCQAVSPVQNAKQSLIGNSFATLAPSPITTLDQLVNTLQTFQFTSEHLACFRTCISNGSSYSSVGEILKAIISFPISEWDKIDNLEAIIVTSVEDNEFKNKMMEKVEQYKAYRYKQNVREQAPIVIPQVQQPIVKPQVVAQIPIVIPQVQQPVAQDPQDMEIAEPVVQPQVAAQIPIVIPQVQQPVAQNPQPMEDIETCCVCMESQIDAVFVPCGHLKCCMDCATDINTRKGECPLCRTKIQLVVKVFGK
jgi:hypothetical protein